MDNIKKYIYVFFNTLLDLIYPEEGICFICEKYDDNVGKDHICNDCRGKLVFIGENKCSICGKSLELGYLPDKCPHCVQNKNYFTKAISPLEYTGLIKDAIYKYKYRTKSYMYKTFGELLIQCLDEIDIKDIDVIVPVPLHKKRKIDRGFNQAELIGSYISRYIGCNQDSKNLIRTKRTSVQNKLNKKERQKNVKNAFKVKSKHNFNNRRVLLIDDILTTGATANECSKVLLKAGAKEVYVITIATGRNT